MFSQNIPMRCGRFSKKCVVFCFLKSILYFVFLKSALFGKCVFVSEKRKTFQNTYQTSLYFPPNKNQKLGGRVDLSVNYDIISFGRSFLWIRRGRESLHIKKINISYLHVQDLFLEMYIDSLNDCSIICLYNWLSTSMHWQCYSYDLEWCFCIHLLLSNIQIWLNVGFSVEVG